jgi:Na+/melibiose symporter-like transporter
VLFHDLTSRAQAFGIFSGMGRIGTATGPLIGGFITPIIGGFITPTITWRAAFTFKWSWSSLPCCSGAASMIRCQRRTLTCSLDTVGAILSAAGLVVLVIGIMAADNNFVLSALLIAAKALIISGFFAWVRSHERVGKEARLSTELFRNRTSNLGLVTQNVQWLMLTGNVVRGFRQSSACARLQRHQDRCDPSPQPPSAS